MTAINTLLGVAALVLLLGVVGEKDKAKQFNITLAFVSVVALIAVLNR
jgi:hypothetical protein